MVILFQNKVSSDFASKIKDIATKLGADVDALMFVMDYETAGTFSPSKENPSSRATGLIQFLPSTAIDLGTTIEALAKESAVEQLDWVYRYLKPYRGDMTDLVNTYLTVFYPAAIDEEDTFIFPANVVSSNPSFFKTGNTKGDFRKAIKALVYSRVPTDYYEKFFQKKRNFLQIYQRELIVGSVIIVGFIVMYLVYRKIVGNK